MFAKNGLFNQDQASVAQILSVAFLYAIAILRSTRNHNRTERFFKACRKFSVKKLFYLTTVTSAMLALGQLSLLLAIGLAGSVIFCNLFSDVESWQSKTEDSVLYAGMAILSALLFHITPKPNAIEIIASIALSAVLANLITIGLHWIDQLPPADQ